MSGLEIITTILAGLFGLCGIYVFVGLIRVLFLERKILALKKEINNKPNKIRERIEGMPMNQSQVEKMIKIEQNPLIEESKMLETKRQFILDKLPLFKK